MVSGRASYELTQKAVLAGIGMLVAVSAPSSLAVDLAAEAGLTLVGFVRGESMNVYTHPERIVADPPRCRSRRSRLRSRQQRRERGFPMGTARDLGLLMLRVGVGAACFSHGAQKLFGWFGGGGVGGDRRGDERHGLRARRAQRPHRRLLETAGGAMLALGLATGPVGAALTGNMIVASSVHAPNGFFNTNGGYELPVTYALVGEHVRADRAGPLLGRPPDRRGAQPALDAGPRPGRGPGHRGVPGQSPAAPWSRSATTARNDHRA